MHIPFKLLLVATLGLGSSLISNRNIGTVKVTLSDDSDDSDDSDVNYIDEDWHMQAPGKAPTVTS